MHQQACLVPPLPWHAAPCRDQLLAELNRWVPKLSIDPTFHLVGNMSSPEEADAGFAIQANTGEPGGVPGAGAPGCWPTCLGPRGPARALQARQRAWQVLVRSAVVRLLPACSSPGLPRFSAGLEDLGELWETEQWKNVSEVTCWAEGHVERVRGTDAAQFR